MVIRNLCACHTGMPTCLPGASTFPTSVTNHQSGYDTHSTIYHTPQPPLHSHLALPLALAHIPESLRMARSGRSRTSSVAFFVRFVASVFKYLDRFYVKRLALPDVTTTLHAALPLAADA